MNIAMVHYGESPHPAHKGFAQEIDADLIRCDNPNKGLGINGIAHEVWNGVRLSGYDVYIAEGSRPLYSLLPKSLFGSSTLVYLCGDHRLYQLIFDHSDGHNFTEVNMNAQESLMQNTLSAAIDGVIAVSRFCGKYMSEIVGDKTPIRIAEPYVDDDRADLSTAKPAYDSSHAVTVASASRGKVGDYKGIDLLIEAWDRVREYHENATLDLVGTGHLKEYDTVPGVTVRGYVDNLADAFEQASLYIQPSRIDAFGVAVVESMLAGVPPVVTETTGARSAIKPTNPCLIVNPAPGAIADRVIKYFDTEPSHRRQMGSELRNTAQKFDRETQCEQFAKEFTRVYRSINIQS